MRYGSASSTVAAGTFSGSHSRAARRVPSASGIRARTCSTGADPRRHLASPRVNLRLSDEQHSLREEAAAFATSLRPTLEADPEWRRQGMLSDGDSRAVTQALGEAGWIGMTWR